MVWQQWYILILWIVGALIMVGSIGRPRKPISPTEAVVALILYGFGVFVLLSIPVAG